MNRTIKFRVFDTITGHFLENFVVYQYGNVSSDSVWIPPKEAIVMQFTGLYDSTKWAQLTKKGQQDWIDDGNTRENWPGREIYDGDILYLFNLDGHPMQFEDLQVVWQSYGWYVRQISCFESNKSDIGRTFTLPSISPTGCASVIGNIYDIAY